VFDLVVDKEEMFWWLGLVIRRMIVDVIGSEPEGSCTIGRAR
jgi:hypothetical protein